MTKIRTIQILRGTTLQNNAYTGFAGELSFDTTTNQVRVHDGTTAGGHIIGSGGGYHPDLFSWQWADHELNDVQWLRADTFSWQSGAVYQAAYQHLADDIDGKTLQSETIGSTTIQFYLADDGHKICPASEESNVAAIYTATGVAWYYILDTVNQRFKLPRTKYAFTGIRNGVGNYVEAGLPNITGKFKVRNNPNGNPQGNITNTEGAFSSEDSVSGGYTKFAADENSYTGNTTAVFNAHDSSSVYGNASTVQSPATEMYLYFYVGNFTQTALENTAGLNAELFNDKVDKGHQVIAFQAPTAGNNYTWYRKYADGWVEQGGRKQLNGAAVTVNIPVSMTDTNFTLLLNATSNTDGWPLVWENSSVRTTSTFYVDGTGNIGGAYRTIWFDWEVKGMAA